MPYDTIVFWSALCLLTGATLFSPARAVPDTQTSTTPRTRERFTADWRFARFGDMPDGGTMPEPGGPRRTFVATASSSEAGHTPDEAADGRDDSRWCAADGNDNHWLMLDLGQAYALGRVTIDWEYPIVYRYRLEGAVEPGGWRLLADRAGNADALRTHVIDVSGRARYLRVTVTHVGDRKWASIRELGLTDDQGRPIENRVLEPEGKPAFAEAFDDRDWRRVDLPHDWGVEGPFRMELDGATGKLPWFGIGWYRKHFTVPAGDRGKRVFVDFDGAMSDSTVWVNGVKVGGWPYGYSSFRVELTEHLRFGGSNVLAVRLDNKDNSSRWYPGGGLYRNVWLVMTAPVHVAHWGVFVTTPRVSPARADIRIQVEVENQSSDPERVSVETAIHECTGAPSDGAVATTAPKDVDLPAGNRTATVLECSVDTPRLWDVGHPNLYRAVTTVRRGGRTIDTFDTVFGIRTIEFPPDNGFLLNGKRVPLNGVCNHHDLGPLGSAINVRALERQLELLREMGCNAIRTSHNPPAPELLTLCDRMGFLVMDEAFDCWRAGKRANDYARFFDAWHDRDVRALVRRDRNHPCVVLWSSGNEIHEQGQGAEGVRIANMLRKIFHEEDPTRLVTAGCNNAGGAMKSFYRGLDALGLNYKPHLYAEFHRQTPDVPVYGSETASCVSSRGEYFFPVSDNKAQGFFDFQVSSYDLYAPPWAMRPDIEFASQDAHPFVAGEFVWTGFDYLGEPTPYNKDLTNLLNVQNPRERKRLEAELKAVGRVKPPSRSSYFGILDLCGFKKDRFFLYQAKWRPDLPMAHILPHWNWPERVGQVTPVHVYTSGDEGELLLNGRSLGRKRKAEGEYRLRWDEVVYQPGELLVRTWRGGKPWAEDRVQTTGPATHLTLTADRPRIAADGDDLCFVTATIVDDDGRPVPRADNRLTFSLSGPATLAALGNGDATSHEPFIGETHKAFNALCLAIVRSRPREPGTAMLRVAADGLRGAELKIIISNDN